MRPLLVPEGGFRRIAVLRLSSLGDVVLTLPVVHALARAYPNARLDYWTKEEYADVVRHDAAIHHVRELESDARKIEDLVSMSAELEEADLIVDLHHNLRTKVLLFRQRAAVLTASSNRVSRAMLVHARWAHSAPPPSALARYEAALAPLNLATDRLPRMTCGEEAEHWAAAWLTERAMSRPVAIAPAARHATKRWPEARWIELVDALSAAGHSAVVFSLAAERTELPNLASRVEQGANLAWCTERLSRMAGVMSRCAAAVTCDTGLMHVAAARGLRVVALFGSTSPKLGFAPAGEGHAVLCRNEPCQPCTLHGRERCPLGHFHCMTRIDSAEVWAALGPMLA